MAKRLEANYEIPVRIMDGGGKTEYVPLSDINSYISTEEASDITDITTLLGTTRARTGSTISADVATLHSDVNAATTGLKDTTAALQAVAPEYKATFNEAASATLTTGSGNSEIDWVADVKGAAGNDISLTFEVPATSLSVATNTAASELILTAVKGVHPVSITFLGGLSKSLAVSATGSDITVQLATDGSSVVTSTAANTLAAIVAAMAPGQPLNGIISSAVGGASYDGATLMLAKAIDYFDATTPIAVTGSTDIVVSLVYDGATDLPLSTATEVLTAVNLASSLITGNATGTGGDAVAEMEKTAMDATGVNGQVGATGKIIFTATGIYCCTDGTKCVITDSSGWKSGSLS